MFKKTPKIFHINKTSQNNNFNKKKHDSDNMTKKEKLYPNCDLNVYLRTCEKEIIEPIYGNITGNIPVWLNGTFLRNGPGAIKFGNDQFQHLFDGSALLHRFAIENGNVTYQCRFLQSEVYKKNNKANRIILSDFGTQSVPDPCHSIFDRVASIFNPKSDCNTDNSSIAVYPFGDQVYAFGEVPIIHQIDTKTLTTEKRVDVSDYVSIIHHSGHPHVTEDGTYNLATSLFKTGPHYTIVKFPPHTNGDKMLEKATIVAAIPVRKPLHPSYMHSFGITDNYFIIVDQPLTISVGSILLTKMRNGAIAEALRWLPKEKTIFNLVNRKTGKLAYRFYADTFFFVHIINQFEYLDYLIIDICVYKDASVLECMYIEAMKTMQQNENYAKMFRSKPMRFVLPLNTEKTPNYTNLIKLEQCKAKAYKQNGQIIVKPEPLSDFGCELPRIYSEQYLGKPYRYFYAISSEFESEYPITIIKVDTYLKKTIQWYEKNCYPNEAIFVPNPQATSEDDGVLLSAIVWGKNVRNHTGLLILNAKTLEEIGRAEFFTPSAVPTSFHGWFFPEIKK